MSFCLTLTVIYCNVTQVKILLGAISFLLLIQLLNSFYLSYSIQPGTKLLMSDIFIVFLFPQTIIGTQVATSEGGGLFEKEFF